MIARGSSVPRRRKSSSSRARGGGVTRYSTTVGCSPASCSRCSTSRDLLQRGLCRISNRAMRLAYAAVAAVSTREWGRLLLPSTRACFRRSRSDATVRRSAQRRDGGYPMTRARTIVLSLVTLALLAVTSTAARADVWTIDPAHTTIAFSVRHMMVSNVRGKFAKFSGSVDGDAAHPTAAKIAATIEAGSIDTANEKRDAHLRSDAFLDVAKFPTIAFASMKIEKVSDTKYKITGDLTLHGVTKEVVLDVSDVTPPIKDPMGNMRAGAEVK